MQKLQTLTSLVVITSLVFAQIVWASPTIESVEDQSFDENDSSSQLWDITITQEAGGEYIEAGYLKLILPDSVEMIYNDERMDTEFIIYGTAVDNGRVLETPELLYENGDKELWIPIVDTFLDDEYMVITRIFTEGYHSSTSQSASMTMQINDSETTYENTKYFSIKTSGASDNSAPEMPSDIVVSSSSEGVELTWEDPTDLDLQVIQVLRGVNGAAVSGTAYVSIGDGEQYFLDDDLDEGDEVSYILRASDGLNYSDNSDEYSTTYTVTVEEEVLVCEEGYEEDGGACVTIEEEPACEEGYEELDGVCITIEEVLTCEDGYEAIEGACIWIEVAASSFPDIEGHWGETYIEALVAAGVVSGNDDGTFAPDGTLDRAALAKMLVLAYTDGLIDGVVNPFEDVSDDDWYVDYAASAYSYGIMTGEGDGNFNGSGEVNRATLVQAVYNAADYASSSSDDLPFSDVSSADWFFDAVYHSYWLSVVDGEGEDTFNPSGLATRAAAAKVIYNGWYSEAL